MTYNCLHIVRSRHNFLKLNEFLSRLPGRFHIIQSMKVETDPERDAHMDHMDHGGHWSHCYLVLLDVVIFRHLLMLGCDREQHSELCIRRFSEISALKIGSGAVGSVPVPSDVDRTRLLAQLSAYHPEVRWSLAGDRLLIPAHRSELLILAKYLIFELHYLSNQPKLRIPKSKGSAAEISLNRRIRMSR